VHTTPSNEDGNNEEEEDDDTKLCKGLFKELKFFLGREVLSLFNGSFVKYVTVTVLVLLKFFRDLTCAIVTNLLYHFIMHHLLRNPWLEPHNFLCTGAKGISTFSHQFFWGPGIMGWEGSSF
jgi:hypothetical protein